MAQSIRKIAGKLNLAMPLLGDPNLQGYYRMEAGKLLIDESGNGRDLTNTNSVAETTSGKYGGGMDMGVSNTATTKYLNRDNDAYGITNQVAWSISGWFNLQQSLSNDEQDSVFGLVVNGYGTFWIRVYKPGAGTPQIDYVRNNGLTQEGGTAAINPSVGTWYHVVLTVAAGVMNMYVNGTKYGPVSGSATGNGSSTAFRIGNTSGGFDGYIDEVSIYNKVLTQSEVNSLYSFQLSRIKRIGGSAPIELNSDSLLNDANMLYYLRMEGNANDTKGVNNGTGTDITYGNSYGRFGQGALFNGTSSRILLASGLAINTATTSYTIGCWIKPETGIANSWTALIMDDNGSGVNGVLFGLTLLGGNPHYGIGAWTSGNLGNHVPTPNIDGGWHHVVGVWTANAGFTPVKMYYDGVYVGTSVTDRSTSYSGTVRFGFGNTYSGYGTWYKGSMDEAFIMNRGLSATEIAGLYNSTKKFMGVSNV